MGYRLILASASPRRREILSQAGIAYNVIPSEFNEREIMEKEPENYVKKLALAKAKEVYQRLFAGENNKKLDDRFVFENRENDFRLESLVVLGADTVVAHCGNILNKPSDRKDAAEMLKKLQGSMHEVYTGVALLYKTVDGEENIKNFAVKTQVCFYPMTTQEIENYLDCEEYADKAGAYAIQGRMAAYIREIHGDYYNVVGLPLSAVVQELKQLKIELYNAMHSKVYKD